MQNKKQTDGVINAIIIISSLTGFMWLCSYINNKYPKTETPVDKVNQKIARIDAQRDSISKNLEQAIYDSLYRNHDWAYATNKENLEMSIRNHITADALNKINDLQENKAILLQKKDMLLTSRHEKQR